MSLLSIYEPIQDITHTNDQAYALNKDLEHNYTLVNTFDHGQDIAHALEQVGVTFERWQAQATVSANDSTAAVLHAYADQVQQLKTIGGYSTADVMSLDSKHPDKDKLREKFLSEHTHTEDEVRFFVAGSGLFCLHIQNKVYAVLCEQQDLISVPAGVTHWFDMGSQPSFTCIRLFIDPAGWVAHYTGSTVAQSIPNMDSSKP